MLCYLLWFIRVNFVPSNYFASYLYDAFCNKWLWYAIWFLCTSIRNTIILICHCYQWSVFTIISNCNSIHFLYLRIEREMNSPLIWLGSPKLKLEKYCTFLPTFICFYMCIFLTMTNQLLVHHSGCAGTISFFFIACSLLRTNPFCRKIRLILYSTRIYWSYTGSDCLYNHGLLYWLWTSDDLVPAMISIMVFYTVCTSMLYRRHYNILLVHIDLNFGWPGNFLPVLAWSAIF